MKQFKQIIFLTFILITFSTFAKYPISHGLWNQVLTKHVTSDGKVDYMGIKNDLNFKKYLSIMSANPPQDSWNKQVQLNYWINIYNAFTVKLIIDNYPVKSIKDIGTPTKGPWDIAFIKIGDKTYTLNQIEHEILRKQFDEPRIHFAIVCASFSCPMLRNEAYSVDNLNVQLNDQADKFINDKPRNNITAQKAEISELFNWFKGDFTKNGTLADYINNYSKIKISKKTPISYMPYNWSLND